jgi:hypothetical protein
MGAGLGGAVAGGGTVVGPVVGASAAPTASGAGRQAAWKPFATWCALVPSTPHYPDAAVGALAGKISEDALRRVRRALAQPTL